MHLTVTQWRSLVPVAQKSEVSEIAGSVPLETGKKLITCCVRADAHFTIKNLNFVPYSYASATLFPNVHTTNKHEKNLKKTNSNCNGSVVLKVPSVTLMVLMKIKGTFFSYNSTLCSNSM